MIACAICHDLGVILGPSRCCPCIEGQSLAIDLHKLAEGLAEGREDFAKELYHDRRGKLLPYAEVMRELGLTTPTLDQAFKGIVLQFVREILEEEAAAWLERA